MLVAVVGLTLWAAPKADAHVSFSIGVGGFYPYAYSPYYGNSCYYGSGYGYYGGGYYPRYYRRGYYYGPRRVVYLRNGRRYYRRGYYARR